MKERFDYHFEVPQGWMNDPNGLIEYNGVYHAFYQHNPYAPHWDRMHWGHTVSHDLMHWENLPIAMYPDMPYENSGGCFSGSAVEADGRLYLFYTTVSKELGQTQSMAWSDDGITVHKYEGNPIIDHYPADGCKDFRDPKVIRYEDHYIMVLGSGTEGHGRVLWYSSSDLFHWTYEGILYEAPDYFIPVECPDFFPLGDKYVLSFSKMGTAVDAVAFVTGTFDGKTFTPERQSFPEAGPQFYAPQTFEDSRGRRIQLAWWHSPYPELQETERAGAFTIPRELSVHDGKVYTYPIAEAQHLLKKESKYVEVTDHSVIVRCTNLMEPLVYEGNVEQVDILEDGPGVEVFINRGERSFSFWVKD